MRPFKGHIRSYGCKTLPVKGVSQTIKGTSRSVLMIYERHVKAHQASKAFTLPLLKVTQNSKSEITISQHFSMSFPILIDESQ